MQILRITREVKKEDEVKKPGGEEYIFYRGGKDVNGEEGEIN